MVKIMTEERKGITVRYIDPVNTYQGRSIRVYLLPNVPVDAGELIPRQDLDRQKETEILGKFKPEHKETVKDLWSKYEGESLSAVSVLLYAEERGRFDEFAEKLRKEYDRNIIYMHPDIRTSRTDVMAFFNELYAELGVATVEAADEARKLADFGPGLVVMLRDDKRAFA
ncbi:MAG: hypothetical protein KGH98_02070 [Candidatus Micrarchaeota archaeon]|nr:hypothetical protein [Candidatus Micrarchaeota archaeon]